MSNTPGWILFCACFWGPFQVDQLQLDSLLLSCSRAFLVLWQDLSTWVTFVFFYLYSVVFRDGQVPSSAISLFLLWITSSYLMAKIRWFVCISKFVILFIITMKPLNHIIRKCTASNKITKSPNVHGRHQTVCQKWKRIRNSKSRSQDIWMEFGLEKCVSLVMTCRKRHFADAIELPNQDKIRTLGEKEI